MPHQFVHYPVVRLRVGFRTWNRPGLGAPEEATGLEVGDSVGFRRGEPEVDFGLTSWEEVKAVKAAL